eukprot:167361-Chlamydomonas_euryale.AAC.1
MHNKRSGAPCHGAHCVSACRAGGARRAPTPPWPFSPPAQSMSHPLGSGRSPVPERRTSCKPQTATRVCVCVCVCVM